MSFKFSKASRQKLSTAHPDLQRLMEEVIKEVDIAVIEGHRSEERQNELKALGFSNASFPNSPHNKTPAEAVDITPVPCDWRDHKAFYKLANVVKRCAEKLGIEVEWGGDFKWKFDGAHFQLKQRK